jgi:DNA polymerase III delta prime subunit
VIAPIRSRCLELEVKYSVNDIVTRIIEILKKENITFEMDVLKQFIERIVKTSFPDIRHMIKMLEAWTVTDVLKPITLDNTSEWNEIVDYVIANVDDPLKVRKFVIKNEGSFNRNYQKLLGLMFNQYASTGDIDVMVTIADSLRNCGLVLDHEIEFTSCVIAMNQLQAQKNCN